MQLLMLCKCVLSRKLFETNPVFMSLVFMYNSNMSSISQDLLNVLLQISHLESMSGSNECDQLERKIRNYLFNSNL